MATEKWRIEDVNRYIDLYLSDAYNAGTILSSDDRTTSGILSLKGAEEPFGENSQIDLMIRTKSAATLVPAVLKVKNRAR